MADAFKRAENLLAQLKTNIAARREISGNRDKISRRMRRTKEDAKYIALRGEWDRLTDRIHELEKAADDIAEALADEGRALLAMLKKVSGQP